MKVQDNMTKRIARQLRRFCASDDGVAAVEWAFIGPFFIAIMMLIFESGVMLFTEYVLQTSVQEAARIVRTGQAQTANMTASTFKTEVCKLAKFVSDCEGKVTVYMRPRNTFTELAASIPSYIDIGPEPDAFGNPTPKPQPFNCGTAKQAVALIATYDYYFYVPFMKGWDFTSLGGGVWSGFGNVFQGDAKRLVAFSIFQNEPFPASANACVPVVVP